MSSGERPIGAAKGKQSDTEALCHPPPPLYTALCSPQTTQTPSAPKLEQRCLYPNKGMPPIAAVQGSMTAFLRHPFPCYHRPTPVRPKRSTREALAIACGEGDGTDPHPRTASAPPPPPPAPSARAPSHLHQLVAFAGLLRPRFRRRHRCVWHWDGRPPSANAVRR